jgi:hypothetical protein
VWQNANTQQQGMAMRKLLIAAIVGTFCATGAFAQTNSPTTIPAPPSTPAASKAAPKKAVTQARSPESLECSKQADAQGLKGKPRKTFRAKCKKDLLKKKA